jgi:crotonobetainyl-CoA:carnitine CoA-transferase CaiB-like acyl-CoA transferase
MTAEAAVLPLEGIRVLDFGQVVAGPVLGHVLADMGAEVIHVSSGARPAADLFRADYPAWIRDQGLLRNRLSVTINMRTEEGRKLARRLAARCDVLTENFAPGVMARLGMDYPSLSALNPGLVMISMSAPGQTGPLRDLVAYGPAVNALSGFYSQVGYEDGELAAPISDDDHPSGIMGVLAVLSALYWRAQSGDGQYIDLAFWEGLSQFLGHSYLESQLTGRMPGPRGNSHPAMYPHDVYPCEGDDCWISIAVGSQDEWRALCGVLGRSDWAHEPHFTDAAGRRAASAEIDARIAGWTKGRRPYEAMAELQAAGVPATPVLSIPEVFTDPHDIERRTTIDVSVGSLDRHQVFNGIPWHLSRTPGSLRLAPPRPGEHNRSVFANILGLDEDEVMELEAAGILA